jgi:hypothetical protein
MPVSERNQPTTGRASPPPFPPFFSAFLVLTRSIPLVIWSSPVGGLKMDSTLGEKIEILIEASRHLSDDEALVFMLAAAMLDREAIRSSGDGFPDKQK